MILGTLKIIYNGKKLFILQFVGEYSKSKNGLYCLGDDKNELFFAFECLNDAKKIISEIGIEYVQEIEEYANIDNIILWVRNEKVEDVNLDELMDFNNLIISYISYIYDGALPKEFLGFDYESIGKAIGVQLQNELAKQYSDIKQTEPERVANIEEVQVVPDKEIKKILNSPELKKNFEILLNFFKVHMKIIKSQN